VTALIKGLVTTVVWMPAGLEKTVTARAATFIIAIGLAILVTLPTKREERP
jgi:sodium/proline symporter